MVRTMLGTRQRIPAVEDNQGRSHLTAKSQSDALYVPDLHLDNSCTRLLSGDVTVSCRPEVRHGWLADDDGRVHTCSQLQQWERAICTPESKVSLIVSRGPRLEKRGGYG